MKVSYRVTVPVIDPSSVMELRKELELFLVDGTPQGAVVRVDIAEVDGKSYEDFALDEANFPPQKISEHGEPTVADVLHFISLPAAQVAEIYTWKTIGKYADIWNGWING